MPSSLRHSQSCCLPFDTPGSAAATRGPVLLGLVVVSSMGLAIILCIRPDRLPLPAVLAAGPLPLEESADAGLST